jgi:phosphoserine phosphatase
MDDKLIINGIDDLISKFNKLESEDFYKDVQNRNAVFDLDNTLLIGDIGDALFTMLKIKGFDVKLSWQEYEKILQNEGKEVAYSKAVSVMAGLSVNIIEKITKEILTLDTSVIEIENVKVRVPKPHPVMLKFIEFLKQKKFNIFIISATNIFSVRIAGSYLFDIPKENCFGINPEILKSKNKEKFNEIILSERIKKPLTVSTGKAELYNSIISNTRPLITAGDSESDVLMLNLVDKRGFSLWIGDDIKRYKKIKKKIDTPDRFYYFPNIILK